jgi:hypothetical protein
MKLSLEFKVVVSLLCSSLGSGNFTMLDRPLPVSPPFHL